MVPRLHSTLAMADKNTRHRIQRLARKNVEELRGGVNADCPPPGQCAQTISSPKVDLDGKTDSGPEPEVHGREIPPQGSAGN